MEMPQISIVPPSAFSSWFTHLRRVDFPLPEGPMMETACPFSTVKEMSFSTSSFPKLLDRFFISSIAIKICPFLFIVAELLLYEREHKGEYHSHCKVENACDYQGDK